MTRRRSPPTCGTITIGLILLPILGLFSLFGLVLAAQAMGVDSLTQLGEVADSLLAQAGLVYAPTAPPPTADVPIDFAYGPLAMTPQPEPFQPVPPTGTPSPTSTPSSTSSPSPTMTPSDTPTETPTSSTTATLTESPSPTSSPTTRLFPTATRTRAPTRSPTRTPTRIRTPTPSPTMDGTSTETSDASPTMESSTVEVPPTAAAPTLTPTARPSASSCDAAANSSVEGQVIALINDERVDQGLPAYSVDSRLTAAARVHATDMACNHFTSHTGSDGSSVRDRVERQGYDWSWIGENYFVGGGSAQTAFNWWMNSGPHTANILSPNYTQFGVGYVFDADSDHGGYFVVVFSRPG